MMTRAAMILALALTLVPLGAAADGEQQFADLGSCKLENGQRIDNCRIGYRTFGTLAGDKSNAILFPTYFTGTTADLMGLVGPGRMLDSTRWFVVLVDALGDGVSSSPSNSTAQPRMKFPVFTIQDMVDAEYRFATETLHLQQLHAVIGVSMGGMQTFEWALRYPDFVERAIPIVGSPQLTSTDLLLWSAELHALEDSTVWDHGNYQGMPEIRSVTDIHQFALTTPAYRAANPGRAGFPAYLSKAEADTNFDWNNWYRQLQAMMSMDALKPWGGSFDEAAKLVKPKMLIVVSEHDHMVNPIPALRFAALAFQPVLELHGNCGHIAPGCEADILGPAVERFLAQ